MARTAQGAMDQEGHTQAAMEAAMDQVFLFANLDSARCVSAMGSIVELVSPRQVNKEQLKNPGPIVVPLDAVGDEVMMMMRIC